MHKPQHVVRVRAPSRLHFGLLPVHMHPVDEYGGVGAMIAQPSLNIEISPATSFSSCGPLENRVTEFARRWMSGFAEEELPACHVKVLSAPRQHVGLGVGTQLALSVGAGLSTFFGLGELNVDNLAQLASCMGRGRRSSVGILGFLEGGVVVHYGKFPEARTVATSLPEQWRFVLIRPEIGTGLSGESEHRAFTELSPTSREVADHLLQELNERMLPALKDRCFERFSESLYRYGYHAGMYFAERQGGPFNGGHLESLVKLTRELGVRGVGQSSWGPTMFALLPDQAAVEDFLSRLRPEIDTRHFDLCITKPNNTGATVEIIQGHIDA